MVEDGILDKRERTPQDSVKFLTAESCKILQDLIGSQTKSYKMVNNFSQDAIGS